MVMYVEIEYQEDNFFCNINSFSIITHAMLNNEPAPRLDDSAAPSKQSRDATYVNVDLAAFRPHQKGDQQAVCSNVNGVYFPFIVGSGTVWTPTVQAFSEI